ncbi:hypothetical protein ACH4UR_35580 [Streptomyces lydicus]|uniref:hypothetical protein n=1 Tax=Streptomyces lydicus TaxID=47763 RepID=UPI0033F14263
MLEAIAGLRQTACDGQRIELALWGGHGRLILHIGARPPAAGLCGGLGTEGGQGLLLAGELDPLEDAGRRSAPGTFDEAEDASRALRGHLRDLPQLAYCEHTPPPAPPIALTPTRHISGPAPIATAASSEAVSAHRRAQDDLLTLVAGPVRDMLRPWQRSAGPSCGAVISSFPSR